MISLCDSLLTPLTVSSTEWPQNYRSPTRRDGPPTPDTLLQPRLGATTSSDRINPTTSDSTLQPCTAATLHIVNTRIENHTGYIAYA